VSVPISVPGGPLSTIDLVEQAVVAAVCTATTARFHRMTSRVGWHDGPGPKHRTAGTAHHSHDVTFTLGRLCQTIVIDAGRDTVYLQTERLPAADDDANSVVPDGVVGG
jgi:hypothetical protein